MLQSFLPEGRLHLSPTNRALCASMDGLRRAMADRTILEGLTILCDTHHDLIVRVGPFTGLIPRTETALGIAEGTTREVAILSRVGKPICFTLEAIEGNSLLLSRRSAQTIALAYIMKHWQPGDVISATVTHLEPFGAFVDIGCGVSSLLPLEQISVSRIPNPGVRFSCGDEILAVVTGIDPDQNRITLSHKALLGTWAENAARFSPGITVTGIVRGLKSYGLFVELTPNLSGLADPYPGLKEGDRVSVYIKSIQPDRRKIKLVIIDQLPPDPVPEPPNYFTTGPRLKEWRYLPDDPDLW